MKKITVSILTTLLMLSMVFSSSVFAAEKEVSAWDSFLGLFSGNATTTATEAVGVEYRGHIQNVGNYPLDGTWIQGPTRLGTVGQSLRLEGFWIQLTNKPADVNIEYEVHVQNVGWMAPVDNGDFAGTEGKSQQIEAIKIRLVKDNGDAVTDYSVNYRGHVQNIGDTAWYTDGQQLGTDGQFLRLEALEVEIVKNPADLAAYNAAKAAASALTEADYTAGSWAALQTALTNNVVTEDNLQAEVDAATAAITAATDALVMVPRVVDFAPINATQVLVTFNAAMDDTSAVTLANYDINGVAPTAAVLSDDAKSVTLTFAAAASVEVSQKVAVVDPIVTAADSAVSTSTFSKVLTYVDTVKPTLVSATSSTNGATASVLTVEVSEPVASTLAKVDGVYKVPVVSGSTLTFSGLSLDAATSHTVELINLTDKATTPNITVTTSTTFNITTDVVAPTAVVSAKTDKTILITFSKSMDPATVVAALPAGTTAVMDETFTGVTTTVAAVVANTDNTQFTVAVTSPLYATLTSRTLTVILPSSIKDSLGNAMVTTTPQVVMTKDTTKPAPTGYKVLKNATDQVTGLEVTFSEELATGGAVTVPTIVNSNGQLVTATFLGGTTGSAVTAGDTKITYTFTTPAVVSGVYSFSFVSSLVSDRAETPNTSNAFDYSINFGSAASTFNVATASGDGASTITVTFDEAVRGGAITNSATDITKYTLAGLPLPAGTTITLDGTQKIATIVLPTNGIATTDVAALFTASGINSLTGNTLNAFTGTVSVADNTQPILTSAAALSNKAIVLTYDEAMGTFAGVNAGTEFTVYQDGTVLTIALADATVTNVPGYTNKLTFTIVGAQTLDLTKTITIAPTANAVVTDAAGNGQLVSTTPITVSK